MVTTNILGMTVLRGVPDQVLGCLASGACVQHGGVIRVAKDREGAGQIIRHLVLPYQTAESVLSPTAPRLLQTMQATQSIASLNLAVSSVGFAALFAMLSRIEGQLEAIAQDVKAIRELLERRERAELHAALERLAKVSQIEGGDAQRNVLVDAYRDLSVKLHQFREQLAHSDELTVADANERLHCVTMLALARCQADMGSLDLAASDLRESIADWQEHTRSIAKTLLLGDEPHRFLHNEFVDEVPATTLESWLSFAHGDAPDGTWIDHLRRSIGDYYDVSALRRPRLDDVQKARSALSATSLRSRIGRPSATDQRSRDFEDVIPFLNRLTARNEVLEGYALQYQLMAERGVSPLALESQIHALPEGSTVEGFVILEAQHAEAA